MSTKKPLPQNNSTFELGRYIWVGIVLICDGFGKFRHWIEIPHISKSNYHYHENTVVRGKTNCIGRSLIDYYCKNYKVWGMSFSFLLN